MHSGAAADRIYGAGGMVTQPRIWPTGTPGRQFTRFADRPRLVGRQMAAMHLHSHPRKRSCHARATANYKAREQPMLRGHLQKAVLRVS